LTWQASKELKIQAQGIEAEIPQRLCARNWSAEPDPGGSCLQGCARALLKYLGVRQLEFKFIVKKFLLMLLCFLLLHFLGL